MPVRATDLLEARALVYARRAQRKDAARAMTPPDAAATRFDRELTKLVSVWESDIMRELEPLLPQIGDRPPIAVASGLDAVTLRTDALPPNMDEVLRRFQQRIDQFLEEHGFKGILDAQFLTVNRFSMRQLSQSLSINITDAGMGLGDLVEQFRTDNVLLIKRALEGSLQDLSDTLSAGQGQRVETIRDQIEQRFGVSRSRAALIARDQTLKLNANVNRQRQQSLGITRYKWVVSGDERVRGRPGGKWPVPKNGGGNHWDLRNQVFEWMAPPVVDTRTGRRANPGEDYQCRCTATPVLDGIF